MGRMPCYFEWSLGNRACYAPCPGGEPFPRESWCPACLAGLTADSGATSYSEADALRKALTTFVECHEHPMGPASACSLCAPARSILAGKGEAT